MLGRSAPDGPSVLDAAPEWHARLTAQAAKFSLGELSRIRSLLVAAQTDMRWTTSPRLTLELALVRATMPDTDPTPEALIARLERLERLAGVHDGAPPAVPERRVEIPEAAEPAPAADEEQASPPAPD